MSKFVNWAIAAYAKNPPLFMLNQYGVPQPVDINGIDKGFGTLYNPKLLNGKLATYNEMDVPPEFVLGTGPDNKKDNIDLYSPRVLISGLFGEGEGDICEGNDPRLSDKRDPTRHAADHYITGDDWIRPNLIGAVGLDDPRLEDKREPYNHAETHYLHGEDRISPMDIGAANIFHHYPLATSELPGHVMPDNRTLEVESGVMRVNFASYGDVMVGHIGETTELYIAAGKYRILYYPKLQSGTLSSKISASVVNTLPNNKAAINYTVRLADIVGNGTYDDETGTYIFGTDGFYNIEVYFRSSTPVTNGTFRVMYMESDSAPISTALSMTKQGDSVHGSTIIKVKSGGMFWIEVEGYATFDEGFVNMHKVLG